MSQFEKYHPILTPHYTFDWLTKVRAVDVFHLCQQVDAGQPTMLTTADYINQTMREIFHDQQLVWAISDRQTDQFIGRAGFAPIDMTTKTATISVELLAKMVTPATLSELYQRLLTFGTDELHLTQLTVNLPVENTDSTTILNKLGFTAVTAQQYRYQV